MIFIEISDRKRAEAVLLLVKSGFSVVCLANRVYGVREEHLKFLKRKRIGFRKLDPSKISIPVPALAE